MNRFILAFLAIAALGCSIVAARKPWFSIPVSITTSESGEISVTTATPAITTYYHIAALAMGVLLFVFWILGRRTPKLAPSLASLWMTVILLYPYFVMVWDPVMAGKATWLEAEHRNLVWSGGDIITSLEYRIIGSTDKFMAVDTPNEIEPTILGDWQPSQWRLARLPELVDRIGYSDKFFEFLRPGWIFALAGVIISIVILCVPGAKLDIPRGLWAFGTFAITFLAAFGIACGWSFRASACLASAAELTADCQYDRALDQLQLAVAKHPSLQEATYFIAQTGLLEDALHRDTPAARFYRANLLERGSRYQQADEIYDRLLHELPEDSPVRREAARALLRSALNDLNAGQTLSAIRQLKTLQAEDTCNLKVNYLLQIAYLRSGNYEPIPLLVNQMDAIYTYFQYLNKQSIQYAAHNNAMIADCRRNDLDAAIMEARKAVEP